MQFPTSDGNSWQAATASRYVEFDSLRNIQLETDAAAVAADSGRQGNSIVYLTNSAGGLRAMGDGHQGHAGQHRGHGYL